MSILQTLPNLFVERTKALLLDEYPAFEKALQEPSPVSIRLNDKLPGIHALRSSQDLQAQVPWCEHAYYLAERPLFTADPLLHAGVYYVQEASSMFLHHIAQTFCSEAEVVLDLCAAPGGKSTLLSQVLPAESLLVSNEIVSARAHILAENITKWGNPNVIVTNNTPIAFSKLPSFFDVLVVDAPCSGEGMFRKDPQAIAEWSVQNVNNCANRQKEILQDSWNCLKEGGLLIYSTCTYNREENEDNIVWAMDELGAELLRVDLSQFDEIIASDYGYRFYPHRVRGEGFFMSILKKRGHVSSNAVKKIKLKYSYKDISANYAHHLMTPEKFVVHQLEQEIIALPKHNHLLYKYIYENLNCLLIGLCMAEVKAKNSVPAHQLALSKWINKNAWEIYNLDYQQAIAYLRRENIELGEELSKNYILVTYKHQPLGWIKNLGNRVNNMYPQHWRVRMKV